MEFSSSFEREPSKRRIKPPSQPVLEFEFNDSTDDSDFNIDDLKDHDQSDESITSDEDNNSSKGSGGSESDFEKDANNSVQTSDDKSISQILKERQPRDLTKDLSQILICCVCLGDRSDHANEIVECDHCLVSVHEGCYGVSDSASVASSDSLTPTEPWFCEPCKAGVDSPACELCPYPGGIFKVTDVGRWVHLVCALYIPGVAFGDVERLTSVTLFEMPYSKWGTKPCRICSDERLARCGVTISCDAGMCRQNFHVTCAQRDGLLSEAHSEEVDQADPFYAQCKLHTDKTVMRRRRNNYALLAVRQSQRKDQLLEELSTETPAAMRIKRKLERKRTKYALQLQTLNKPWVPTQKMPRLLTTSASAVRALWRKAELMDIDVLALESKAVRAAALQDIGNKWHVPPAFTVEFTAYFLDRNMRVPAMKRTLQTLLARNEELSKEHEDLDAKYSAVVLRKQECESVNSGLRQVIEQYHKVIHKVVPNKRLPIIEDIILTHGAPMMVPTAAALKAGVGYPILRTNYKGQQQTEPRIHSKQLPENGVPCHECGICRGSKDQHLLTRCDTCHLYYHLGCLNPPLTRMPKKTKQMGWQCSECDKDSSPDTVHVVTGPRRPKPKTRDSDEYYHKPLVEYKSKSIKKAVKRPRAETPPPEVLPRIKIKIKNIGSRDGKALFSSSDSDPIVLMEPLPPYDIPTPRRTGRRNTMLDTSGEALNDSEVLLKCNSCNGDGSKITLVTCDECQRKYHFGCLDPPLKKTPKVRGYSWHCAECDPSDEEKK